MLWSTVSKAFANQRKHHNHSFLDQVLLLLIQWDELMQSRESIYVESQNGEDK